MLLGHGPNKAFLVPDSCRGIESRCHSRHHWKQLERLFGRCFGLFIPPLPEGGGGYTVLLLSVCPSVQDIFRRTFHSKCWWQKSDIWSQALYRYTILWVAFLDPSDSYFLFAEERGYHKWALAHSSSCWYCRINTIYIHCR